MVTDEQDERYARAVLKAMAGRNPETGEPTTLFERAPKFVTLEEINEALTKGIYGE